MKGTISRIDAYETLTEYYHHTTEIQHNALREALERVPDAQPERLTDDDFETIRIHLNAYKEKLCNQQRWEEADEYQRIIDRFMAFASAQPETHDKRTETHACDCISRKEAIDALAKNMPSLTTPDGCGELDHDIQVTDEAYVDCMQIIHELPSAQPEPTTHGSIYAETAEKQDDRTTDGWCVDCKEYDTENKCCHRYNRVIKQTLDEAYRHGETEAEARFHDEIVRCKDCKYNSNTCGNYVNCDIIPQMFGRTTDNFCSRAERRTDERRTG